MRCVQILVWCVDLNTCKRRAFQYFHLVTVSTYFQRSDSIRHGDRVPPVRGVGRGGRGPLAPAAARRHRARLLQEAPRRARRLLYW